MLRDRGNRLSSGLAKVLTSPNKSEVQDAVKAHCGTALLDCYRKRAHVPHTMMNLHVAS